MGADLNNIIKTQKLSDDHVQFLIYQIIRGMKYVLLSIKIKEHDKPKIQDNWLKLRKNHVF